MIKNAIWHRESHHGTMVRALDLHAGVIVKILLQLSMSFVGQIDNSTNHFVLHK